MRIAVPKERQAGETRVALTPDVVQRLTKQGHEIVVESGAGASAGAPDSAYTDAGARIAPDAASAQAGADLVVLFGTRQLGSTSRLALMPAERIARQLAVPVLTFPVPEAGPPEPEPGAGRFWPFS